MAQGISIPANVLGNILIQTYPVNCQYQKARALLSKFQDGIKTNSSKKIDVKEANKTGNPKHPFRYISLHL